MESAEETFVALVGVVGEPIRRYVARRVPADIVDDTVAEVCLVLWRRLDDVPLENPLPWTYAVARGCVANARRAGRRRGELADRVARLDPPRDVEPDPEYPEVHDAMATLSDLDREIVSLWAWEGLPPREIATSLEMTPNAVSTRLTRAKQKLAEELRKDPPTAGHEQDEGRNR